MALNKNQSRNTHGTPESPKEGDPSVLARQQLHQATAKWRAKWLISLHGCFGVLGFAIVLLPAISKNWRSIVENTPVFSHIFYSYSSFSGLSMSNLFLLIVLFFAKNSFRQNSAAALNSPQTNHESVRLELYPKTKREEATYWIEFLDSIASVTLWLFLPFGTLAYFILMSRS